MLYTFFKTGFRNLWKRKSFSLLNILGLTIGIASASLIFLWVEDELTFNDHFKNKDQLYQIMGHQTYDGEIFTFQSTPGPLAPAMKAEIPGIKTTTRVTWTSRALFSKGDNNLYGHGVYADSSFFPMFTMEFIQGNVLQPFSQLHSVVLSDKFAMKVFNRTDVVGQTIKVDNQQEYIVSGVYRSLPTNARFSDIEWVSPFKVFESTNSWLEHWGANGLMTYALLEPNADVKAINTVLKTFITKRGEFNVKPELLAANDWRLHSEYKNGVRSGGRIRIVTMFTSIAWIVIILACINFMNLSTARSEQRAREVGVRKVLGSGKSMLIGQFLAEALLMSFLATLLAVGVLYLVLPAFNQMVEKQVALNLFSPVHLGSLLLIALLCGLIAGSYPAFYLSSFNPLAVLKGFKLPTAFGVHFIRRGLVVSQFVISVALIICTMIIYQQVIHTKDRQLGINRSDLIAMEKQLISMQNEGDMRLHFKAFKNELLATGLVENAALNNSRAFEVGSNSADFSWKGKEEGKNILISMDWALSGYIGTMGMQLLAGRDFYEDGMADSTNVIINESMAKLLAKDPADALAKQIDRDVYKLTVVGVVKDYLYNDIYGSTAPLIIFYDEKAQNTSNISIRFKKNADYKESLAAVEGVVKKFNPLYPFEYRFVDEEFNRLFKGETLIGKLAALFAGLAIFISCLGLFGLAAYMAERRTKEIGVRKVLGAGVGQLSLLLSVSFLKLVLLSCAVAIPISWWVMNDWLQTYEYRVHLQWWMFALPGVAALTIALVTVSIQAIKAALANPIKSLRTE